MASESIGSIHWDLDLDDKKFKQGLDESGKKAGTFGDKLKSAERSSQVFTAGVVAAGAAAVVFGLKAFAAYGDAEKAQAQLEHAVIGVTHATQEQLKQTEALADSLEKKGVLDGDNIKMGLAQLSTFGLSNKAVQALGGSLADLAVNQFGVNASGEQLSDTANMIAKALNGQFGILEKSGIRFTDLQKRMIETGTEMQKVTAINEGFAQNLKYTNEVARGTGEGIKAHLFTQLGNIQEAMGKVVSDGLKPLMEGFSRWIDSMGGVEGVMAKVQIGFAWMKDNWPIIAGIIIGGMTPAIWGLVAAFSALMIDLLPFMLIGAGLVLLIQYLLDKFGGLDGILKALQPTLEFLNGVWTAMKDIFSQFILPILLAVWDAFKKLWDALKELWVLLEPILLPILKVIGQILGTVIIVAIMAFLGALYVVINVLKWVVNAVSGVIQSIKDLFAWFKRIGPGLGDALGNVWEAITSPFKKAFEWIKNAVGSVVDKLRDLNPFTRHSPSLVDMVTKGTQAITSQYGSMFQSIGDMASSFKPMLEVGTMAPIADASVRAAPTPINVTLQSQAFMGNPAEAREFSEMIMNNISRLKEIRGT